MVSILNGSLPQEFLINLVVIANLPKKLLPVSNSLNGRADTSTPLTEVLLANSTTGFEVAIIDLDKLIDTPNSLQRSKYRSATSLSKRTKSSPKIIYSVYQEPLGTLSK